MAANLSRLNVELVASRRQWRDFFLLRPRLYRDDPADVRPLREQERWALDVAANPFYEHARCQPLVCYERGRALGRVVAIHDHMHHAHCGDRTGFFGFFEVPPRIDVAAALLDAAAQWLAAVGCDAIRGPVNPSLKSEFGVQLTGHAFAPYVMMAHTPAHYPQLLEELGFSIVRRFFAFRVHRRELVAHHAAHGGVERLCRRILDRHRELRIRSACAETFEQDLDRIHELANRVRQPVWGFVPLTRAELDQLVRRSRRVVDPRWVLLAEHGTRLVGYVAALADVNWALRRTHGPWDWLRKLQLLYWLPRIPQARIYAIGVDEHDRRAGVAAVLLNAMLHQGLERYEEFEISWIAEDNRASLGLLRHIGPMECYKTYALYQRNIGC